MSDARVLLNALWLRSGPARRVLDLLNDNGEEARVVGGAVRNALLNIPLGDIDIATTAIPDEVIRRARAAGIKSVPTGIEHGTVTLVVDIAGVCCWPCCVPVWHWCCRYIALSLFCLC